MGRSRRRAEPSCSGGALFLGSRLNVPIGESGAGRSQDRFSRSPVNPELFNELIKGYAVSQPVEELLHWKSAATKARRADSCDPDRHQTASHSRVTTSFIGIMRTRGAGYEHLQSSLSSDERPVRMPSPMVLSRCGYLLHCGVADLYGNGKANDVNSAKVQAVESATGFRVQIPRRHDEDRAGYRPEIERDMDGGFGNRGTRMEKRPHSWPALGIRQRRNGGRGANSHGSPPARSALASRVSIDRRSCLGRKSEF